MRNFDEFAEVENLHFKFRDLFHRVPLGIRYLRLLRKAQVSKNPIIRYYYDKRRAYLGEKHNIEILKEQIYELAGTRDFNIASTKQLGSILF